ncbi:MAG: hypothetical protein H6883_12380 [Rhodobiaceae bacterium]|nr:hypothetical protein [Rhodobiaceae bacterium]MCC0056923.1 hypothetical protein [Rhodobiaceae bacterium]
MSAEQTGSRANGRIIAGIFAVLLIAISGFIGLRVYEFQHSATIQAGRPAGPRVLIGEGAGQPLLEEAADEAGKAFRETGGVIVETRPEPDDRKSRIWMEDYRLHLETVTAYGGRRIVIGLIHLDSGEELARNETFIPDNAEDVRERLAALASRTATEWTGLTGIIAADNTRRKEKSR